MSADHVTEEDEEGPSAPQEALPEERSATSREAPREAPHYEPGTREYARVTAAMFAAGLATFAALYTTQPLLPLLTEHFGVPPASATLSVSVTTLALGLALLVAGPLSEVLGRTRVMMWSLFGTAVMAVACAFAPTWPVLLLLRGVLGVTVAGLPAVAVAYLREEVAPGSLARATGLYIGGTAIGGMSGRLIAGGLADLGGWRAAVAGIGVLALGCAVFVRAVMPPSRHFVPVAPQPAALWSMTRRVLSDPVLIALYLLPFTTMGAFVACYNAMGFRLAAQPYELSAGVAGLVFVTYALGSVSSARAGRLADRFGHRAVVPASMALMLVSILLTLLTPLPVVVLGLALFTIGFFACHGVASGWVAARAAVRGPGAAQASSLYTFMYYLGSSVAGALAGQAWSHGGWAWVVGLCGGLCALGLLISLWLRTTTPLHEPPARPEIEVQ